MIVVTGAGGFIGRYLVDELAKDGYDVLATVKSNAAEDYYRERHVPFSRLDVTKQEDFEHLPSVGVEGIAHLAAALRIDADKLTPAEYLMVNALGTYNVLEYARRVAASRTIYTMTHSDVSRASELVVTEKTPRQFGGDYGPRSPLPFILSKVVASDLVEQYDRDDIVQGVVLRLANIRGYGSRDTERNCVFHQFIQRAVTGEPIEIWGRHSTLRDMIYVKDVTAAIRVALRNTEAHGLYNIGSGKGLTIEDEAKAIVRAFSPSGRRSTLVYRPEIEEVRKISCIFDITKARRDLKWEPKYTYDEAMVDYKQEMERGYFMLKR